MQYHDQVLGLKGRKVALARLISRLTPAPFINLYVGMIVAILPPTLGLGPTMAPATVVLVCLVLMVIAPVAPIIIQAYRGVVDLDISSRELRTKFFVFALVCYSAAYAIYWLGQCDVMRVLAGAYFAVTTGVMMSTLKWKVSVHAAGVGGPGTALMYMYGILASPVILVWLAVLWARPVLEQHTAVEGAAGLLLAVIITFTVYSALY